MRILVTGGAGFIGSHVARHVHEHRPHAHVVVLDKLDYCASLKNIADLLGGTADVGTLPFPSPSAPKQPTSPRIRPSSAIESHGADGSCASHSRAQPKEEMAPLPAILRERVRSHGRFTFVHGDVCDSALVEAVLRHYGIGIVMHFAAQTHVDNSFDSTLCFTHTNVTGTHILLEACRRVGSQIMRIIHVSTDEVYGGTKPESDSQFLESESPLDPTNPYSASKAAAEMIVKAYQKSFRLPILVTRGNNVYGPCQYPEKLVPKFILRALSGSTLPIHGDGSQRRGYVHVLDVAAAFDLLIDHGRLHQVYNIGSTSEISVLQVARDVCVHTGRDARTAIQHVTNRTFQDHRYLIDHASLAALGWEPRVSWEEGLADTVAWYRRHPEYWGDVTAALQPHTKLPVPDGGEEQGSDVHRAATGSGAKEGSGRAEQGNGDAAEANISLSLSSSAPRRPASHL